MAKELAASAATCQRIADYLVEHVQSPGASFHFTKEYSQRRLAERCQLSEMHMSRVIRQLRRDGRLVQNPDRSWTAYADADPSRVKAAAKKMPQRGSVFELQQTVNQLQQTADRLLERLETLAPPQAGAAGVPSAAPPADHPLRVNFFFEAADEAELEKLTALKVRGGGASLSEQTQELYRAMFGVTHSLPDLAAYIRRLAATRVAAAAARQSQAAAAAAPAMPSPASPQPAAGPQAATVAAAARSSEKAPAVTVASAGPEPAAAAAADLSGIPGPQGQLRPLVSGTSGVPADWPADWPAGDYASDERGLIFYVRGGRSLPLPRGIMPDQAQGLMRSAEGYSVTPQQLLEQLQERARLQRPQWQDYLSCLQLKQG